MQKTIVAAGLAVLAAGCTTDTAPPAALAGAGGCAAFDASALGLADGTSAWKPAAEGAPAYCEVTGTLRPVAGSNIGVVYRLPESWNGKVYGTGGGGWIGNIALQTVSDPLRRGYATMQTDAGHPIGDV